MLQLHHPGRQVATPDDKERMASVLPPAYLSYAQKHPEAPASPEAAPHILEPVAPSPIFDGLFQRTPRALSLEEIEEIIHAFAEGIRRAQEAGFDGAQLHAAHGWLLSSFLSPRTNQRTDLYGGSSENRTRIVTEIYRRARAKVGDGFPILIKFNTTDFLPVARIWRRPSGRPDPVRNGFDALEVSGECGGGDRTKEELGWPPVLLPESRTAIRTPGQEAYFLPPPGSEGTYRGHGPFRGRLPVVRQVEEAVASGAADFVSLARPLIRQPDLPRFWYSGQADRAACISCNACLPVGGAAPLSCKADLLKTRGDEQKGCLVECCKRGRFSLLAGGRPCEIEQPLCRGFRREPRAPSGPPNESSSRPFDGRHLLNMAGPVHDGVARGVSRSAGWDAYFIDRTRRAA
jgi:2,4-dienoyl-CoA reductase-like NADH-dependent reductase (Old Yellow Enzyme family)